MPKDSHAYVFSIRQLSHRLSYNRVAPFIKPFCKLQTFTWILENDFELWLSSSYRNYEGCQKFYDGLNNLKVLPTLEPCEWLDRFPPFTNAERDFINKERSQCTQIEIVLREHPEHVCKFYDLLFEIDVLKEVLLGEVTDVAQRLPDSLFYEWVTFFSTSCPSRWYLKTIF